jgi:hypothetical protein
VTTQINAIELNPELVNIAYEMGLNVSKMCENALKEAIRRLQGFVPENNSFRNAEAAGSNPARSIISFEPPNGKDTSQSILVEILYRPRPMEDRISK